MTGTTSRGGQPTERARAVVPSVYVSTACIRPTEPLRTRLEAYQSAGLRSVELGAGVAVSDRDLRELSSLGLDLLVHNYFPPPADPFVLNLASADPEILQRSETLVREAMRLCVGLGVPVYTVHAGFVTDPVGFDGMSFRFPEPEQGEAERAFERFSVVITRVTGEAEELGLALLVENNVCTPALKGRLLLQTPLEFGELFQRLDGPMPGILLDTGHLNVSAHTLGFDRMEFVRRHRDRIRAVHLHDNDGTADQHRPAEKDSWTHDALDYLFEGRRMSLPIIVEAAFPDVQGLAAYVHGLADRLCDAVALRGQS